MKLTENFEIQRLKTELKEAKAELKRQEKFASLGRELSKVNHDLVNINYLTGETVQSSIKFLKALERNIETVKIWIDEDLYQEIILDNKTGQELIPKVTSRLELIESRSERTLNMLQDLKDYTVDYEYKNNIEVVNVNGLIKQVLNDSYELSKSKNIVKAENFKVDLLINCNSLIEIYTDKNKLLRILSNLLNNAFYSLLGKTSLLSATEECYRPQLKVDLYQATEEIITIIIEDNGCGISEEYHQKIFEPFVSFKNNKSGSTGLGLTIVKEFVNLLHGTITLESEYNKYARFKLSLPMKLDD